MLIPSLMLASAAVAAAQKPTTTNPSAPAITVEVEPCLAVAALVEEGYSNNIPAEIAYECLNSVPVDVEGNADLIDELKMIWEFHSETGWLENTPSTFENGPIDLLKGLDEIKAKLPQFESEYAVQLAIWALTVQAANYHLNYVPDILKVFQWVRPVGVISLSDDGKLLPHIYLSNDSVAWDKVAEGSNNFNMSAIEKINGEEAHSYLEKLASLEQYLETDARLNKLFYKGEDEDSVGNFMTQTQYDGGSTYITFANGTEIEYNNFAKTIWDFEGVVDGKTFFQTFCTGTVAGYKPDAQAAEKSLNMHKLTRRAAIPETYPPAVVKHSTGAIAGYFLNTPGFQDVAVLKVITFEHEGDTAGVEFQAVAEEFLAECVAQKKQKLIIDLRQNGGGSVHLLLDLFMQLFPKDTPFSAQRYRATEQYALIGDVVNEIYENAKLREAYKAYTDSDVDVDFRPWSYTHFVNAEGKNFKDWLEYFGPNLHNNDLFTTSMRYNYSNADEVSIRLPSFYFSNVTNNVQPFKKENIVMFTDGLCGSSCASFHEELKNIAGIKAVVVGGRAKEAPMQTVSGTKGGEVTSLYALPKYANDIINATDAIGASSLWDTSIVDLALTSQALIRVGDVQTRLETQIQIRKGDTTGTPLEFIYEAADCKIFYTMDTLFHPEEAWMAAWRAFTDSKHCVKGSTGDKSSISGGFTPYGSGPLKPEDCPKPSFVPRPSATPRPSNSTGKPNLSTALVNGPRPTGNATHPVSRSTARPTIRPNGTGSVSRPASHASSTARPVTVSRSGVPVYGSSTVRPVTVPTSRPATQSGTPTRSGVATTGSGQPGSHTGNGTTTGVPAQFTGAAATFGATTAVFGFLFGTFAALL
ncbi:hypothetical protein K469DRAFT_750346 [Zopfia rhizophila CBS 207.26]|uniref:Uncharacterized protein n=1 Tax=Zopfia rhizophila CBS 207.26 TaxID=1314779 RepID=A0A6A6E3Q5_9PEZI|nr:hypothetical protein K469DRAFT_750346 [Zopfia rhizophila CBS 207.26]